MNTIIIRRIIVNLLQVGSAVLLLFYIALFKSVEIGPPLLVSFFRS